MCCCGVICKGYIQFGKFNASGFNLTMRVNCLYVDVKHFELLLCMKIAPVLQHLYNYLKTKNHFVFYINEIIINQPFIWVNQKLFKTLKHTYNILRKDKYFIKLLLKVLQVF